MNNCERFALIAETIVRPAVLPEFEGSQLGLLRRTSYTYVLTTEMHANVTVSRDFMR